MHMNEENIKSQEELLSQEPSSATQGQDALKADQDKQDYKDKYMRLLAEFDNMRKRHERERSDLIKYAHEEVIIECLKIYEDLERSLHAFKSKEGMDANLVKGLDMVYNSMRELMNQYDVKPLEVKGKPFDPNTQEVLMQQETSEFPDGVVMEELGKGYTLGDRVVRTAKVKVAKNIN